MYQVSAAFKAQIQKSHVMGTRVEVLVGGLVTSTSLIILEGSITIQDVDIRRTMSMMIADPTGTLTPDDASSLLSPVGTEIKPYRGCRIDATGLYEYAPLGVFGLNDVKIYDSGGGFKIGLEGGDRARKVQRAKLADNYIVAEGTNYGTAIQNLIAFKFPQATFTFTTTTATTPLLVFKTGEDPWRHARNMAESIGMDLFFDANGVCVLQPVKVLTGASPVDWSFVEGPTSTFMSLDRRLTDEGVYSHVVFTGENTGVTTPVRADAYDTNPLSPTYYLGPFGDVVYFEASKFVTTTAQAQAAADAKLAKVTGFPDLLAVQALVNPAHEVDDVVQVTRVRSKVNKKYLISKLTIPMTQDRSMAVALRKGVL